MQAGCWKQRTARIVQVGAGMACGQGVAGRVHGAAGRVCGEGAAGERLAGMAQGAAGRVLQVWG